MDMIDRTFSIVVPKYDNSGSKIDVEIHKKYAKEMYEVFNGVSVIPVVLGCWHDKDINQVICEENIMLFSSRDYDNPDIVNKEAQLKTDKAFIKQLARQVGTELGQRSVMTEEELVDIKFVKGNYQDKLPKQKLKVELFERYV